MSPLLSPSSICDFSAGNATLSRAGEPLLTASCSNCCFRNCKWALLELDLRSFARACGLRDSIAYRDAELRASGATL